MRTFVALELGEDVQRRIGDLVSGLRPGLPGVRWVKPEGCHLTLRFLGDAAPDQVARLEATLEGVAAACPVSDAVIRGLGVFPERGQPRVLWLGVAVAPSVRALQAACERVAVGAGFPPERRPFEPHLTIGRWRERSGRPALPSADIGSAPLDTLTLFRSDLRPGGSLYTPLRRLALGSER